MMKKPVLIAFLVVALLAGGLVTAAYGASPNSPLYAVRTSILGETPEDEVTPPDEDPAWEDELVNLDELKELDQLAELDEFADLDIKDYKSVDPELYTDTLPVDDGDDPVRPGDDEWTYQGEWVEGHFSVIPLPDCTVVETEPNPVLKKLADIYGVTYEEVKGWYCVDGRSLPEITTALNVSSKTGIPVADLFAKRDAGMSWAEILKEAGYTHDDMLEDPILPPGLKDAICLDTEGLAKLKEMAAEYDMPIDEMIAWYCEGNGFEELEKAFSIFKEIGIDMDKILADHNTGLSWEEMMKGYGMDENGWPDIDLPSHDEKLDKLPEDMEKVKEAMKDANLEDLLKKLKDLPMPPWPGDDNP